MSTFITIIQHNSGSPGYKNQKRKTNKRNLIRKEVKHSLFADDIALYIENPKDSTRKLQDLTREFSQVEGYKINTQKSLSFLYITMRNQKEKLRKQSHSPLQQKE